jgi:hypothetical protein
VRSMRTSDAGAGGSRETSFSVFAFALAKAVALTAFVAVWFSAFFFAARSFYAITAAVNPTASAKPWVFFFLQVFFGTASGSLIRSCARVLLRGAAYRIVIVNYINVAFRRD